MVEIIVTFTVRNWWRKKSRVRIQLRFDGLALSGNSGLQGRVLELLNL